MLGSHWTEVNAVRGIGGIAAGKIRPPPFWGQRREGVFANPSGTTLYATTVKAEAGKLESSDVRKLFDLPLHPAWAFYDVGRYGNCPVDILFGTTMRSLMIVLLISTAT